jgi:hypothetical protein
VIPPDASAAFVANMEDVLEVYQRPHDPQRPLVCLDETSKQLIIETRAPIPAKPGRKARHDYEYERNGVANLFMVFAPLEGWRLVKVTDRHTAIDFAHMLRDLSDLHFPDAVKIVLVQDNLNTHKPASLYEAFPAVEARRLVERFEWHYTPKHGSWLDMAESELGVLASQCLDRRIADMQILAHEVNAWQDHRNKHHAKANWQFKTADARVAQGSPAAPEKRCASVPAVNRPKTLQNQQGFSRFGRPKSAPIVHRKHAGTVPLPHRCRAASATKPGCARNDPPANAAQDVLALDDWSGRPRHAGPRRSPCGG